MVIYNLLVSFEDLQKQVSILSPKSIQVVFFRTWLTYILSEFSSSRC